MSQNFKLYYKQFLFSSIISFVLALIVLWLVKGVTLHSIHSFPSRHTATAFTFVLLIALTVKRLDVLILSFIVALLIAYSRIYLGQHFPLDIGGGIIVSIGSVSSSVFVQKWFERRRLEKAFLKAA
ncbi:MAG TPA: phosphatase PAP2 family protein [Segetibacter sp.]|nr:phosphatase PAP2 family protein [Segetibacter sp.]